MSTANAQAQALTVLHLSDTHFGTEQAAVQRALLDLAESSAPDAVVVTGDLTQRATALQFEAAQRFLAQLPRVPTLVLPGNHDIKLFDLWTRLFVPYRAWSAVAGEAGAAELRLDDRLLVVAADTTRRWRHRHGTLSRHQIEAVAARLTHAPQAAWRMVATHHPLCVAQRRDLEDRPRHHDRALARWPAAGAQVLLAGHIHLPGVMPVSGTACSVVQAGTALSHRLRPGVPNSVNLLCQAADPMGSRRCERWDYDAGSGRFVVTGSTPLGAWAGR